ncbi:hypothetical protein [Mycolicibacterium brumae]|uniref:Uncharacterized protein n=1 Tax=Mycolicibacterium brumae TaxID=85968 RepID=A0A2G5PC77_9MYCO|nr:hypothetical protein [Mycolicibacterium brumae]MCV7193144.1 hypothetical protein [Mycolicibacterium brumae]PIB75939.1 hypothetical protein CQY22_007785 [Mycolicibacterium brumae]RWA16581.1 hypothetical protein MBRU_07600 [Mycolicibacterium brumae DSM 44177]UWW09799.1 hypothetical protein L2Z93_002911 [Mycolicibacterium brumae]
MLDDPDEAVSPDEDEDAATLADLDYPASQRPEFATGRAYQILDEVALRILEIRLALMVVTEEVSLRLDDFYPRLTALELLADQAVGAAGLLLLSAELDDAWGSQPSRPQAVYARHKAAVSRGAPRAFPPASSLWHFNTVLKAVGEPAIGPDFRARPQCPATIRDGSRQCSNGVLYLGGNAFASGCFSHATEAERDRYRQHQDDRTEANVEAGQLQHLALTGLGRKITRDWLRRRHEPGSLYQLINQPDGPFHPE